MPRVDAKIAVNAAPLLVAAHFAAVTIEDIPAAPPLLNSITTSPFSSDKS